VLNNNIEIVVEIAAPLSPLGFPIPKIESDGIRTMFNPMFTKREIERSKRFKKPK
jgi:hypothetical protein